MEGDLVTAVKSEQRDMVVTGSVSVVQRLMAADLVDGYRLMTFPTVLGSGRRLFPADGSHAHLECLAPEQVGGAALTRYRRAAR